MTVPTMHPKPITQPPREGACTPGLILPPAAFAAALGFYRGPARLGLPDAGTSMGGPGNGLGDQPELAGAGGGFGAVGRAELAEQVSDVLLDGIEGDDEVVGDLLVGCAGGEQVQHLHFAG